jgi:hypothetical protein
MDMMTADERYEDLVVAFNDLEAIAFAESR